MTRPALSVVVVRVAGGEAVASTLSALAPCVVAREDIEVLVVGEDGMGTVHVPVEVAHAVRWLSASAGAGPARLRSVGVLAARGAVIALTEDHCTPSAGWCASIVRAHAAAGPRVVGGPIAPHPDMRGADLAFYLTAYVRYMPPRAPGPVPSLSDCNVSYHRDSLDLVADIWREAWVETDVHAALASRGIPLHLDPHATVVQHRVIDLPAACEEQRVHGAAYGRGRAARTSAAARRVLTAATWVLPAVAALRAWRVGSSLGASRLAGAMPAFLRLMFAWSAGERAGYRGRDA